MQTVELDISADIEKIKSISIVPVMLEMICKATGMGFAAVARVTEDRWIACEVKDDIGFGLKPGGELKLETTICNEIRGSREPVIIDHVSMDVLFCNHHTPKMYGFQSYISMPIILHNNEFFGTVCAIDPNPAKVNDQKIIGMFALFAQLIAFHLKAFDLMGKSQDELLDVSTELKRYEHLSYHSLREPVRKISIYSDKLLRSEDQDKASMMEMAKTINRLSTELAEKISRADP